MRRTALRWIALFGALLLAAGCSTVGGGEADVAGTPVLSRVLDSGVLRVGVSGSQPPFNVKSKSGEIIGLEADLATGLANSIGLRPEFVQMPFAELLAALERGDVDVVMSSLTMTPERNARVAFVGPYFISGKGLLTRSDTLAEADDPDDIDTRDVTIVALAGSTSYQFVSEAAPKAELVAAKTHDAGVGMVINGEVDAMVADFPACVLAVFRNQSAGLVTAEAPFTFEPIGVAVPGNDALFINLVSNYIDLLEGSGMLEQLRNKWFADGSWLVDVP